MTVLIWAYSGYTVAIKYVVIMILYIQRRLHSRKPVTCFMVRQTICCLYERETTFDLLTNYLILNDRDPAISRTNLL